MLSYKGKALPTLLRLEGRFLPVSNQASTFLLILTVDDLIFTVHLAIHPSVFATGSEERPYCSLTVDRTQFSGRSDIGIAAGKPRPLEYDIIRAKDEPFLYLLNETAKGVLYCETRGKQMVIAAGHVRVISLSKYCYVPN